MNTLAAVLAACVALSQPVSPRVAIIIDDLGYQFEIGKHAIALPGPIAVGIVPFAPHTRNLSRLARAANKEVILHLPMEADERNHLLGDGALLSSMNEFEIASTANSALDELPDAIGINNHMGSRLSRERQHIDWLMAVVRERSDVFFVDSRTTTGSVIGKSAIAAGVDYVVRDVFLDHQANEQHIEQQLDALVTTARARGYALAIGHPYPITLSMLSAWDPAAHGVELIALADYVAMRTATTKAADQACVKDVDVAETRQELTQYHRRQATIR